MLKLTIEYLDSVDSTNEEMKRRIKFGYPTEGYCIIASYQWAGKGQRGNVWQGNPNENLSFSIFLSPDFVNTSRPFLLLQLVTIACAQAIEELTEIDVSIKWPNDLVYQGNKIGGILIENSLIENHIFSIVGIGINVNQRVFDRMETNPLSISAITGYQYDINMVFETVTRKLKLLYHEAKLDPIGIIQQYHQKLYKLDVPQKIRYVATGEDFIGIILGVDENGCLIVHSENRVEHFLHGSLHFTY